MSEQNEQLRLWEPPRATDEQGRMYDAQARLIFEPGRGWFPDWKRPAGHQAVES